MAIDLQNLKGSDTKLGGGLLLIFLAVFLVFKSYVIVEAGHVGIIKTLGAVQEQALSEGLHFKKPFMDNVYQMDIRLTKAQANATSASKDLQNVQTQVTIQFSIDGPLAPRTYQRIGNRGIVASTILQPAIQESVKSTTARYTAEQLISKREEVKVKIQESVTIFINNTLTEKQLQNAIHIANIAITDFDFSNEFNRAIELKVRAEQEALQAKNEKLKRVTQAEASAAERRLAAEAEAYEIELASKARAAAIQREAQALKRNPELIQLRIAEKWDGKLPIFTGNNTPLIDMSSVLKGKTNK